MVRQKKETRFYSASAIKEEERKREREGKEETREENDDVRTKTRDCKGNQSIVC